MNTHNTDPAAIGSPGLPQATPEAGSNGTPLEDCGQQEHSELVTYDPVPPKRTVTVSVRYRLRGRGQPLHYPVDEGGGE